MQRRDFIAGLGSAAAWPLVARAQRTAVPVIGYLSSQAVELARGRLTSFLKGLAETGFSEGQNVTIEYRWADEDYQRLPDLAADLVRHRVDVIATPSTTASALAAKAATRTIPIVFLTGADPVQIGLVSSLNRPGGNLTGVAILNGELGPKRLEILREVVPTAKSIGYLSNPANPTFARAELAAAETAARILGLKLLILNASAAGEVESAFESLVRERADALVVGGDPVLALTQRDRIVEPALRYRVPTIFDRGESAAAGALMGYGADVTDAVRQVGVYTGRILKGEKSADLPVQQSVRIELAINLKTARALGLTLPLPLLGRADEVIE